MAFVLVKTADGRTVPVREEELQDAIAAGGTPVAAPGVDRFGTPTTTADDDVAYETDPFQMGLADQKAQYRESFEDEGLRAFAEGAARGLTAGLYRGDDESQVRADVNPVASVAGEATGIIGGSLAVPFSAPGLAARAGSVASHGIASTAGRLAVEGAVDGFTYSFMRESVEAAAHNDPFSVESIAAETLAGGGVGAAIGGAIKGAGVIKRSLSKADEADRILKAKVGPQPKIKGDVWTGEPGMDPFASDLPEVAPATFGMAEDIPAGPRQPFTPNVGDDFEPKVTLSGTPKVKSTGELAIEARRFFDDSPTMREVSRMDRETWEEISRRERDFARMGGNVPSAVRNEAGAAWADLQRKRRDFAKLRGWEEVAPETAGPAGTSLEARFKAPDDFWKGALSAAAPAENVKIISKWEEILQAAKRFDEATAEAMMTGERWVHGPSVRGQSERIRGFSGGKKSKASAAEFRDRYLEQYSSQDGNLRPLTDEDELIRSIIERDKMTVDVPFMNAAPDTPRPLADILYSARNDASYNGGIDEPGDAGKLFDSFTGKDPGVVMRDTAAPKRPRKGTKGLVHIDEVMALPPTEAKRLVAELGDDQIAELAAQIRNHKDIAKFTRETDIDAFVPTGINSGLSGEMRDIVSQASRRKMADTQTSVTLGRILDRPTARSKGIPGTQNARIDMGPAEVVSEVTPEPSTGWASLDALKKMNVFGVLMAANFPGVMLAKEVATRYGDKIAMAAESVLKAKPTRVVPTKTVQLGFAKALAPDGDDRDRDIRAVSKASESPEAFADAVDEAMMNVAADSPALRAKAREQITAQLLWMTKHVPKSMSQYSRDFTPSDTARFSLVTQAWSQPLNVLSQGANVPMVQLDAVEQLWPQLYQKFMMDLTEKASTMAAEGKPIPPAASRILPGMSMARTPQGQTILASMRPSEQKPKGGEANPEAVEPTTAVQSMAANRINLNR